MSSRRIRVLTISKPYVAAAYRDKLDCLAALGGLEVGLICPPAWGTQELEPSPPGPPPEGQVDQALRPGYWHRVVPIRWNGRNHFHWYRGLTDAVREFRPDVLNVEEEHYSIVTWQAFHIAARLGIPALFYTWQNIAKRYPPPFSWIERRVFRQAAVAICGNHEAATILRAKGYDGRLAEIPQMGVELARFTPPESAGVIAPDQDARRARRHALGLQADAFWVAFAGRLVEEKGIDQMVEALALRSRAGGLPVRGLIIGTGPDQARLATRVRALGAEDLVRFLGAVPSHAVADYLKAVDAICLPSLTRANWKEQFGRVLVEAMAAEAVPIGSSSGEIPHVIGDAGLVFPEGDVPALATAIGRLADDPALVDTLRRRGAQRVRDHFTNEAIARRFADAFAAAVANGPRRPWRQPK